MERERLVGILIAAVVNKDLESLWGVRCQGAAKKSSRGLT